MKPTTVAALRGLLLALGAIAIPAVISLVQQDPNLLAHTWWIAPGLIGLRTAEGAVDRARGQADQKAGGSGPADPTAYIADIDKILTRGDVQQMIKDKLGEKVTDAITVAADQAVPAPVLAEGGEPVNPPG